MALPQPKRTARHDYHLAFWLIALLCLAFFSQSCTHSKRIYKSNCDVNVNFKKVSFRHLVDSITDYDRQYVEVSGKYVEDKELSALFDDSAITGPSGNDA